MTGDNFIKNKKGVTLLELMVAVSLFTVTILMSTQIFRMVIEGQRDAIASQDIQESMRYTFERLSKEIRTAQKDEDGSCSGLNNIYFTNPAEDQLTLLNYHGDCVKYFLENKRLKIWRDPAGVAVPEEMYITPSKIEVSNLGFLVDDDVENIQSLLSMKMDIETSEKSKATKQKLKMQTTISSRYYE